MSLLSALPLAGDIVVPPPTPPPSHALPVGSLVPYLLLAFVAIGALWLLRKGRAVPR